MSKLGLAPVITATKAPKHYGTSCNSTWISSRDRGYPKARDTWEEEDKCEIMKWFIYKVRGLNLVLYITYRITFHAIRYRLNLWSRMMTCCETRRSSFTFIANGQDPTQAAIYLKLKISCTSVTPCSPRTTLKMASYSRSLTSGQSSGML
jgi:hypothetical protein